MSEKISVTVADKVADHLRNPEKPSYFIPLLGGFAIGGVLMLTMIMGYVLVMTFCNIFWLENTADDILRWGVEHGGLVAARIAIIVGFLSMIYGMIMVAVERKSFK